MTRNGYVSDDPVNRASAQCGAKHVGASVDLISFYDPLPDGEFDRVLLDIDCLPSEERIALLQELTRAHPHQVRAIHSYNLDDQQARRLQAAGVQRYRGPEDATAAFFRA